MTYRFLNPKSARRLGPAPTLLHPGTRDDAARIGGSIGERSWKHRSRCYATKMFTATCTHTLSSATESLLSHFMQVLLKIQWHLHTTWFYLLLSGAAENSLSRTSCYATQNSLALAHGSDATLHISVTPAKGHASTYGVRVATSKGPKPISFVQQCGRETSGRRLGMKRTTD